MVDNDNTTQRVLEEVIKGLKTPSLFPSVSLSLPLEEAEEAGWGGGRGGPLTKLAENQVFFFFFFFLGSVGLIQGLTQICFSRLLSLLDMLLFRK